jgi:predicted nucleic acid-binding protein
VRCLDLLRQLGPAAVIPKAALLEVERKGHADFAVQGVRQSNWLMSVDSGPIPENIAALGLGDGESAVLAYALATPGSGVVLDDLAARSAAATMGIPLRGTLGVILLAKKLGLITQARPVVEQLRHSGMYLSEQVMNQALAQVGE